MSPQIRQYLKVLQMPLAELQAAIDEFLAENPVIEQKQDESPVTDRNDLSAGVEAVRMDPPVVKQGTRELDLGKNLERITQSEDFSQHDYQDDFEDPQDAQRRRNFQEMVLTQHESLSDYLSSQIRMMGFSAEDLRIANEIIGSLDDRGYITESLEAVAESCAAQPERVLATLDKLQEMDPPGICARDLQECLLIQIKRKYVSPLSVPEQIVRDHFALLAKHDWGTIAKRLGASTDEIKRAGEMIALLEPYPGRLFQASKASHVIPDVIVSVDEDDEDKLKVDLRDELMPQLRISSYYRKLLRNSKTDAQTKKYIREKIQSAMNFMNAMTLRGSTLKAIAEQIVKQQKDFFFQGFTHLKPMRLKDVAHEIGIHESTVSRAISGKYMTTPQGTVALRKFFSSKLHTMDGEGKSQTSTALKIKQMIDGEDPRKPLSDQEIVSQLQREGTKIARRTVTKYRELQKILPSHLRRRR